MCPLALLLTQVPTFYFLLVKKGRPRTLGYWLWLSTMSRKARNSDANTSVVRYQSGECEHSLGYRKLWAEKKLSGRGRVMREKAGFWADGSKKTRP